MYICDWAPRHGSEGEKIPCASSSVRSITHSSPVRMPACLQWPCTPSAAAGRCIAGKTLSAKKWTTHMQHHMTVRTEGWVSVLAGGRGQQGWCDECCMHGG